MKEDKTNWFYVVLFQLRGPGAARARTTCRQSCSTRCMGTTSASRGTGQWPGGQRASARASRSVADLSRWQRRSASLSSRLIHSKHCIQRISLCTREVLCPLCFCKDTYISGIETMGEVIVLPSVRNRSNPFACLAVPSPALSCHCQGWYRLPFWKVTVLFSGQHTVDFLFH